MAARKKVSKGRGGSPGRANPRNDGRITEQQHDDAVQVLRAEYYQAVKGLVDEVASRLVEGGRGQDKADIVHEVVDGSYWVIYTHANFQVLMCSDNHDAYSDAGFGGSDDGSIDWAALAFAALEADVNDRIQAEGVGVEEAPRRGRSTHEARGPRGLRRAR